MVNAPHFLRYLVIGLYVGLGGVAWWFPKFQVKSRPCVFFS